MSCRDISLLMSLALDEKLSESEAKRLELHLEGCSACWKEWAAMQHISRMLSEAPLMPSPAGFVASVIRRLRARQATRIARRRILLGGTTLLAGSILIIAFVLPPILDFVSSSFELFRYPSLLGHGLHLLYRIIVIASSLGKAIWLVITSLPSITSHPFLLAYSILIFALIALWTRIVIGSQRGYKPARG
jgi:predicted anti-sigma-YlaC factor YlaD